MYWGRYSGMPFDRIDEIAAELLAMYPALVTSAVDMDDIVADLGIDRNDFPELELCDETGNFFEVCIGLGVKMASLGVPVDRDIAIPEALDRLRGALDVFRREGANVPSETELQRWWESSRARVLAGDDDGME
jgi:hypothetical protein